MSQLYSDSIFWIETEKIKPNPYQPRREFDERALRDLADSIRQYGILQPLTVSRIEIEKPEGGLAVEYELIAGERRLRASKIAGLAQVPVVIRVGDDSMAKLELAIIENLQREDLNAVDRARAFMRFVDEFSFTHAQIGVKVGKSREYVSNTLRLLTLPEEILQALSEGKISEGHTRPIMMLNDRPEEQMTLFKEVLFKKITVREAERIARHIAHDKIRKRELAPDPEIIQIEGVLKEKLGTRVNIERKETGGHITIHFFDNDELKHIIDMLQAKQSEIAAQTEAITPETAAPEVLQEDNAPIDDRSPEEIKQEEDIDDADLYNIKNFSL
ncbi:MAG: ParB/RepB/Spo0J family partition protein [Candidatus Pacebacteria bacterium]|jgi:ParB family chromosome partitioning protein|nr:ParB/RepB/Spo0J family partition protein [Candidatus Paceibacterota bacterium]